MIGAHPLRTFGQIKRLSSVAYTAQKAMFVSATQSGRFQSIAYNAPNGDGRPLVKASVPFGCVDGHAAFVKPGKLVPPDWRGEYGRPWAWFPIPVHGLHTADGVRGRDLK